MWWRRGGAEPRRQRCGTPAFEARELSQGPRRAPARLVSRCRRAFRGAAGPHEGEGREGAPRDRRVHRGMRGGGCGHLVGLPQCRRVILALAEPSPAGVPAGGGRSSCLRCGAGGGRGLGSGWGQEGALRHGGVHRGMWGGGCGHLVGLRQCCRVTQASAGSGGCAPPHPVDAGGVGDSEGPHVGERTRAPLGIGGLSEDAGRWLWSRGGAPQHRRVTRDIAELSPAGASAGEGGSPRVRCGAGGGRGHGLGRGARGCPSGWACASGDAGRWLWSPGGAPQHLRVTRAPAEPSP